MRKKALKTTKRYRLTFVSENTLNTIWTLRMSRARAWLFGALCVAAVGALVALLFGLTPLGSILPGYMRPEQRRAQIENGLRIDSLLERQAVQTAWIENIEAILTGTVDTTALASAAEAVPEITDTLISASDRERKFVEEWTERERYNLTLVNPAVASTMSFRQPVATILRRDTLSGPALRIESTRDATVNAVLGGTVIDSHLDVASGRQCVLIQHPNEFISRYDGLAKSFVTTGQRVQPGAAIGLLGSDGTMTLTLWRAGTPLLN